MIGNVQEWCADWFGTYYGEETDPVGPRIGSSRVIRGGCFWNPAKHCRAACRFAFNPDSQVQNLGFRLAADGDSFE
jgi:formylglycine-generating enzyme required for sulfatase activity